jgi:hypothetical protein
LANRPVQVESWVHVFSEDTFGGRGTRLGPGQRQVAHKIGSIIVGPGAVAKVVSVDGQELLNLRPCRVISNFPKLVPKAKVSHIRVFEAESAGESVSRNA